MGTSLTHLIGTQEAIGNRGLNLKRAMDTKESSKRSKTRSQEGQAKKIFQKLLQNPLTNQSRSGII